MSKASPRQLLALRARKGKRHWRDVLRRHGFKRDGCALCYPSDVGTPNADAPRYTRRNDPSGRVDCDLVVCWAGEVQLREPTVKPGDWSEIITHADSIRGVLESK